MKIKGVIDIEDLLVWTYRDRQADRLAARRVRRGPSLGSQAGLWDVMALGGQVDTSSPAPEPIIPAGADDALIVHDAVLALADTFIDMGGEDVTIWDAQALADADAVVERSGERAIILVDGQRRPVTDAGLVAQIVVHARNATRPDDCADWTPPRGRPGCGGRIGADGRSFEDVQYHRALYHVWRCALVLLAAELDGALAGFDVTGPRVAESPWLDRRRVLKSTKNSEIRQALSA